MVMPMLSEDTNISVDELLHVIVSVRNTEPAELEVKHLFSLLEGSSESVTRLQLQSERKT